MESKSVCQLTSEDEVDTKTDFARSGPDPSELSPTLFQLGWKVEKHTPFGIFMTFEMHRSPLLNGSSFQELEQGSW